MSGPRVVALGGGHGTAVTLAAIRHYATEVTAVVSVADDGGSSGRLRDALGIPAPGDLRRCLVALGEPGSIWVDAFEHRFPSGELAGHPLGNLVIAGLASATGSFITALEEAGRLLGITGRVLPATIEPVVLKASAAGGEIEGQVAVENASRISSVFLVPPDPDAPDQAIAAIHAADQIVIGPGSLYTSVIAVLAVPAIRTALRDTKARKVYVCNLRPSAESEGYDVAAHVGALASHGVHPDVVLYDAATIQCGSLPDEVRSMTARLARADGLAHDPGRLAAALIDLVG